MRAPIIRRIVAWLIDYAIAVVLSVMSVVLGGILLPAVSKDVLFSLIGLLVVLFGLLATSCFVLLRDGLSGGLGCGKRIMNLRVARSDGSRCDWVSSALRNITFLVPAVCFLELLLPLLDGQGLRLGDRIARTQVVE